MVGKIERRPLRKDQSGTSLCEEAANPQDVVRRKGIPIEAEEEGPHDGVGRELHDMVPAVIDVGRRSIWALI
jgi:hypothetical protein